MKTDPAQRWKPVAQTPRRTLRPLRPRRIGLGARAQEIVSEIKREELELEEG